MVFGNRKKLLLATSFVFLIASGFSYVKNGRYYSSTLEFFLIGGSLHPNQKESDQMSRILPDEEEQEILNGICQSEELFGKLVEKESLVKYYHAKNKIEASAIIRDRSMIKVDNKKFGKITMVVQDDNDSVADHLAFSLMNEIRNLYFYSSKSIRNNYLSKVNLELNYFEQEKQSLLNEIANNAGPAAVIHKVPEDSLRQAAYLRKLQHQLDIPIQKILNISSGVMRLEMLENKIFQNKTILHSISDSVSASNSNNILVINHSGPGKRQHQWYHCFAFGAKATLIFIFLLMGFYLFKDFLINQVGIGSSENQ